MRSFTLVSGLAWLHQAAAACCRGNPCLKAIVSASAQGQEDCSTNAVVYVTPDTVTITETRVVPTDVIDATVTLTSTVSTETDVVIVSETVAASTETDVLFATQTVLATATATDTDVVTATPVLHFKKRRPTISTSTVATTSSAASPGLPAYASQCPAWGNYISACSCAGVPPITVTAAAPSTTVTVDATVTATAVNTETMLNDVTATALVSQTTVESVTVTTLVTQTTVLAETATTATVTQTQTTTPLVTNNVSAFQASGNLDSTETVHLVASTNELDQTSGYLDWGDQPPNSQDSSVVWAYNWVIDDLGRLVMSEVRPGGANTDVWAAYYTTGGPFVRASIGVGLKSRIELESEIQPGSSEDWVYGAVNATTNELFLYAGARTNILYCGGYLYLSSGFGEDVEGTCATMQLTISRPAPEQH